MVNSRFSRQWFCDRKAMKDVSVYGGGAVLARISARLGFRPWGLGMFFGIETVSGAGWQSTMAILESIFRSSSSNSTMDAVGEEAVDDVLIDSDIWLADFRETMTPLQNCLYTRRAVLLLWSSKPSQEQHCGRNCCASLSVVQDADRASNSGTMRGGVIAAVTVASRSEEGTREAGNKGSFLA